MASAPVTGRARLLVAVLLALVVTACSAAPGAGQSGAPTPRSTGSSAAGYRNPVYADDFPDPSLLHVGSTFYAFATQGDGRNIQQLTSSDLVHWTKRADALPSLPGWAQGGATWAPEVITVGGRYVMFYVERDSARGVQCIGRATSSRPGGPYVDSSAQPFLCQPDLGGSIDPNPVRDPDGHLYLYWKNDGNCCGKKVQLWGQQLTPDAARLVGRRVPLLSNTLGWQGNLVEAPEMFVHDHAHVLFYSANDYASANYDIGYASCAGPLGPCQDRSPVPLVASNEVAAGPGHCYPFALPDGSTWLLYHAWQPQAIGSTYPGRELWLSPLTWKGAVPQPVTPTTQMPAAPRP
ncbi:MAG TPA: glycoside hydrolase family 43 protein [Propionibacteriaceae bacterium]|nr:glycoside hydrolase family 43 protein [Propionibacteriaceae bacterium]